MSYNATAAAPESLHGTAMAAARLTEGVPGDYYCQLYDEAGVSDAPDQWQGPYPASEPTAAARAWVKAEWDARHGESIRVAVKGPDGQVHVVRTCLKVAVGIVDVCLGSAATAA